MNYDGWEITVTSGFRPDTGTHGGDGDGSRVIDMKLVGKCLSWFHQIGRPNQHVKNVRRAVPLPLGEEPRIAQSQGYVNGTVTLTISLRVAVRWLVHAHCVASYLFLSTHDFI